MKIKCDICGKECSSRGLHLHKWKSHTNEGKLQNPNIGYESKNRVIWNKNKNLSDEHKNNISKSLKGKPGRKLSESEKRHLSELRINAIKNGTVKRWNSISGNSYPEQYFEQLLINTNIKFEKQYHINDGKRNYFLDFYLIDYFIDLEIDGSQHKNIERIKSDERRDNFVKSNGMKVFRIEWKNPTTEEGKKYLEQKFKELIGSIV